jgi:NADPH2:quinone reductase
MSADASTTTTTTAARLHAHGQPLLVETVSLEEPADGEVLVELEYAGVNPIDRYIALGRFAPDGPLPRTLGGEAAGTVDGRPVLVAGEGLGAARDGVWSGAIVVPAAAVIELPEGIATREAAAMGIAGLTAWNCVRRVGVVRPDDRVLVLGASGGVGSMIVSLANAVGATVWGQTGSDQKADLIAEQGADRVIVSSAATLGTAVLEFEPTVVFDPLGGPFVAPVLDSLAPRGRIVSIGTSAGAQVTFNMQTLYRKGATLYGYGGTRLPREERREGLQQTLAALARGELRVAIDDVLPLSGVNEALKRLEGRQVKGKLLLDLHA